VGMKQYMEAPTASPHHWVFGQRMIITNGERAINAITWNKFVSAVS